MCWAYGDGCREVTAERGTEHNCIFTDHSTTMKMLLESQCTVIVNCKCDMPLDFWLQKYVRKSKLVRPINDIKIFLTRTFSWRVVIWVTSHWKLDDQFTYWNPPKSNTNTCMDNNQSAITKCHGQQKWGRRRPYCSLKIISKKLWPCCNNI